MKENHDRLDTLLDRGIDGLRGELADDAAVDAAAARVLQSLRAERDRARAATPEHGALRTCSDFHGLIGPYLEGRLPESRRLLLEDHARECVACRRVIRSRRTPGAAATPASAGASVGRRWWTPDLTWAAAAAVLVGVGLVGLGFRGGAFGLRTGGMVQIEAVDGELLSVSELATTPAVAGEAYEGSAPVRTAKESGAVLRLDDGSRVEMNERSEVRVTRAGGDLTVHLDRGDIIVEAADQGSGKLTVRTPDCTVEVRGTVFAVRSGTKGSRVSVVEGEVEVRYAGDLKRLGPGEQVATGAAIRGVPVADDLRWSRDADRHVALLREFASLERELSRRIDEPALRYGTRLLDLAPADTVVYAAIPNLTATLTEAHNLLEEKIRTSEVVRAWWENEVVAQGADDDLRAALERVTRFGEQLGDEIVVAVRRAGRDDTSVVLLSTVRDADALRALVRAGLSPELDGRTLAVRLLEDAPAASAGDDELVVRIDGDVVAMSPDAAALARLEPLGVPGPFASSSFRNALAGAYDEGAGVLLGADLEALLDEGSDPGDDLLGIRGARHLIVERHGEGDRHVTRAAVTFDGARRGVASWLAAPAPMGSLEFVSPEAIAVSAFVIRAPGVVFDELLAGAGGDRVREALETVKREAGVDLHRDLAGALGGDFAVALDGPILPKPAWKLVAEVYDTARLQAALTDLVAKVDLELREAGKGGLVMEATELRGRTFYAVRSRDTIGEVHYTYADGYLVAAPQRVLVERTLQYRESGSTFAKAPAFLGALPTDRHQNVSAVLYQDFGRILSGATGAAESGVLPLTPEQRDALSALADGAGPTVFCAYGEPDRIEIVGADRGGLMFENALSRVLRFGAFEDLEKDLEGVADVPPPTEGGV